MFDVLAQNDGNTNKGLQPGSVVSMMEQDQILENEINVELVLQKSNTNNEEIMEDSRSQDSEYVEATQVFSKANEMQMQVRDVNDLQVAEDEAIRRIEFENKNKVFLDHSWANIVEDEEAEQNLLRQLEDADNLEVPCNENEFQVVNRSKNKKKTPVKSSYNTRAKTVNPKSFR